MASLIAVVLSLATAAASAGAPAPAETAADTVYATALEAMDRGNGRIAVQLLDAAIARFPAGAHGALHEAQLRLAESYLLLGEPDSTAAMIGRAWAELELAGPAEFSNASDERLVQLIERVATAGRPDLALDLACLREARSAELPEPACSAALPASQVPERTALVLYVVSPSLRRLVLITLTRGGLRAMALAVSDSLALRVASLWTRLAAGDAATTDLAVVGDALVRPLPSSLLREVDHLTIVPGGALRAVPFDLLPDSRGNPLIERHDVTIARSATVALARWSGPERRLGIRVVAVGYAGTEHVRGATAVAQVRELSRYAQRAEVYVASGATEAAIRDADLRSAGLVHLAVPLREGSSAGEVLELVQGEGDDGILTSTEAAGMKLGSPFVLLADCPVREEPRLEGPVLPPVVASFQRAGASAVLWCSRRQPSAVVDPFIREVYHHLAAGKPVAVAVREAKLARRRAGASGAEWSAFILYGDGRARIPLRQPGAPMLWWAVAAVLAGGLIWVSERKLRRHSVG